MDTRRVLLLFTVVSFMATGQVLFKLASAKLNFDGRFSFQNLLVVAFNVPLIFGLLVYGVTTVLWVLVLQNTPLSQAYPFVAISFVLVMGAGVLFFGERFSSSLVIGGLLISAGVVVIASDF